MARKSNIKMTKHTIRLVEGDFARLSALYPHAGGNLAIRHLVHKHIQAGEAKLAEQLAQDATQLPDADLGQDQDQDQN